MLCLLYNINKYNIDEIDRQILFEIIYIIIPLC